MYLKAAAVFMQALAKKNWAFLKRMASQQVYTAIHCSLFSCHVPLRALFCRRSTT